MRCVSVSEFYKDVCEISALVMTKPDNQNQNYSTSRRNAPLEMTEIQSAEGQLLLHSCEYWQLSPADRQIRLNLESRKCRFLSGAFRIAFH
jgi:hypothetical protein